ncbi:MAG: hypothetical protein M1840_003884 [Geoglossum simile]|nr:MAG: hypothetical protein M1840_003884 [Geoglossum simile]
MAQSIPYPDLQILLPPLLACLATACASASSRPPALSSLLSPILRQRVLLLSNSLPPGSWLSLLCWNPDRASRLLETVRSDLFEPHPVSGEVECKDAEPIQFRRLDEETIHAKVVLRELGLAIVYLWCVGDVEGCGDEWKVAEVVAYDEEEQHGEKWYNSVSTADRAKPVAASVQLSPANEIDLRDYYRARNRAVEDDDDDAYWRQYDGTPAPQTPAGPPLPTSYGGASSNTHLPGVSKEGGFARYALVQRALANDDRRSPDKDFDIPREEFWQTNVHSNNCPVSSAIATTEGMLGLPESLTAISRYVSSVGEIVESPLDQPRPSFSSSTSVVARLEETVAVGFWAEVGVKQHLSASIKSLFRVSRVAGVGIEKFARLLNSELHCSGRLEEEDIHGLHQYISSSFYGLLRPARMAGIDRAEIERIVMTELAVLEVAGDEDTVRISADR